MMKRRGFLRLLGLLPAGGLLPVLEGAARSRFGSGELRRTCESIADVVRQTEVQLMCGDGQGGCLVPECYQKDILAMINDRSLVVSQPHIVSIVRGVGSIRVNGRDVMQNADRGHLS